MRYGRMLALALAVLPVLAGCAPAEENRANYDEGLALIPAMAELWRSAASSVCTISWI